MKKVKIILIAIVLIVFFGVVWFLSSGSSNHKSHEIGSVNTSFKMLGSDHVACSIRSYITHASQIPK